jgi:hypothetical protein
MANGMRLDAMLEPAADDALIHRLPHLQKHYGLPLALILRAVREGAHLP